MCTEVGVAFKYQQLVKGFCVLGACRTIAVKVWFSGLKYL